MEMTETKNTNELDPVQALSKDLRKKIKVSQLSRREAKQLVTLYYRFQKHRIALAHQARKIAELGDNNEILLFFSDQMEALENQVKFALDKFGQTYPVGNWLRSITGIGPVITAALIAHIDIEKAPTAGHIHSYAGLNPGVRWEKGKKRPWNSELKVVAVFKAGESFVKTQSNKEGHYGKLFRKYRDALEFKNESGFYKERAATILATRKFDKDTEAYKAYIIGKLPDAHLHAMARRWVVKLFLSHLHDVLHRLRYGMKAPLPYALAHLNHTDLIEPPNLDAISGLDVPDYSSTGKYMGANRLAPMSTIKSFPLGDPSVNGMDFWLNMVKDIPHSDEDIPGEASDTDDE